MSLVLGHEWQAPDEPGTWTQTVGWVHGMEPESRPELPGNDAVVGCVLIGAFLVIALCFGHCGDFLKNFAQDLWVIRKRENVFDKIYTLSENRIQGALFMLACLTEGILLTSLLSFPDLGAALSIIICAALAGGYLFWQRLAYGLAGYVFAGDGDAARQWLRGFTASQSLLGLALVAPALVFLFFPASAQIVVLIGCGLYLLSRLIFIIKGFRLFFVKSGSWFYFILYLCTLEIAPVVLLWRLSQGL